MLKDAPFKSAIFNFLFFAASANSLISDEISTIDFNWAFYKFGTINPSGVSMAIPKLT